MRGLNVCVLGPAALIATALLIAFTPMTSNAAESNTTIDVTERTAISAADTATCTVTDAAVTWGVKETLRSYISGTIANGEWTVSDGASYETPHFGWTGGAGELTKGMGVLSFDGTLRFTGHDGILDTRLSGLELHFDGTATMALHFDVTGTTQDGNPVDESGVQFATVDSSELSVTDDTARLDGAPVTLTEAGAAAFGTYPAGETFDPITVTFSATSDCAPEPLAASAVAMERNLFVMIATSAVVLSAGLAFLVTRWRGKKTQPRTERG